MNPYAALGVDCACAVSGDGCAKDVCATGVSFEYDSVASVSLSDGSSLLLAFSGESVNSKAG